MLTNGRISQLLSAPSLRLFKQQHEPKGTIVVAVALGATLQIYCHIIIYRVMRFLWLPSNGEQLIHSLWAGNDLPK